MTAAELRTWIKRRGCTHEVAAQRLGLTIYTLRSRLTGATPVGAQTARIVELLDDIWACGSSVHVELISE